MGMFSYILLVFLSIFVIFTIYIYWKRKKYTREIYVFTSTSMLFSFAILLVTQILSTNGIFITLNTYVFELKLSNTSITSQVLSLILFYFLYKLIVNTQKNWNGGTSIEEKKLKDLHEEINLLKTFKDGFQNAIFTKELKIYDEKNLEVKEEEKILKDIKFDKLPWNEEVKELLTLKDEQYFINSNDWGEDEKLFISKYRSYDIAIYCVETKPTKSELKNIVNILNSYHDKKILKLIIAVKKDGKKDEEEFNNFKIEYRYENELINELTNTSGFRKYFEYIKEKFEKEEITKGKEIKLQDIYVSPKGITLDKQPINNLEEYILNWTKEDIDRKHLAILGEYGQGKSVLSLKIAYEMIQNDFDRIPILIELRGKSPRTLTPLNIISLLSDEFGMNSKAIMHLTKIGKVLLIFEGFDEMDLVGDSYKRLEHFEKLWEFTYPKAKILITGRDNLFLDDKDLRVALGIHKSTSSSAYCEAVYINKFEIEEIKKFLRNTTENIRNDILNLIKNRDKNESFIDLIARPSTLYLTTIIWNRIKQKLSNENTLSSALIIDEFIQDSYDRQRIKEENEAKPILTIGERDYFMVGIAVGMVMEDGYTNNIGKDKLKEIILKLYNSIPKEVSETISAINKNKLPLKERLKDSDFEKDSVITDVIACGLLTKDLSKTNTFKFAHKSFLEFLVSKFFVDSILRESDKNIIITNSIKKALLITINKLKYSKDTINFITQLLFEHRKVYSKKNSFATYNELFTKFCPISMRIINLIKTKIIIKPILYFRPFFTIFQIKQNHRLYISTITLLFIISYFTYLYIFEPKFLKQNFSILINVNSKIVIIFLVLYIIFLFFVGISTFFNKECKEDIIFIWIKSCKKLGANDEELAKIIGKKYLEILKKEFD